MDFSVSPTALTSCSALILSAAPPSDMVSMNWACTPSSHALCDAVLAYAALDPALSEVTLTAEEVAAAATAFREANGGLDATTTITVSIDAMREFQGQTSATASSSFTFATASGLQISEATGTREWTLVDTYVRLTATLDSCITLTSTPTLEWSYMASGSPPASWTVISGQTTTSLRYAIANLPGEGDYIFRAAVPTEDIYVDFDVVISGIPAPTATLVAPTQASPSCDMPLDASGSTDPSDAALSFSWSCSVPVLAVDSSALEAACNSVVNTTAPSFTISGGSLDAAVYTFTVNVSRSDAWSVASKTVSVSETGTPSPVVSIGALATQVSPQKKLSGSATITESGSCLAPSWQAWWMVSVDNSTDAVMVGQVENGLGTFSIPAPLPVPTGTYIMRLTLSDSSNSAYDSGSGSLFFYFDSEQFLVDEPPANGVAKIYPTVGNVSSTLFRISTLGWVDDDLPLQNRFSWKFADGTYQIVSAWTYSSSAGNILIGKVGSITARAEARDTLGSITAAYTEATVQENSVALSEADIASSLASIASAGDTYATLSAVSALASTAGSSSSSSSSSASTGASDSLASEMLAALSNAGVASDPTAESVASCAQAVTSVLSASATNMASRSSTSTGASTTTTAFTGSPTTVTTTTTAPTASADVADEAATLLDSITAAAATMEGGLETEPATDVMAVVSSLLRSAKVYSQNDTTKAKSNSIGSKMRSSATNIGDAITNALAVGDTSSVASGGVSMFVQKTSFERLAASRTALESVILPPLNLGGRRLATCTTANTGVSLQETVWPDNPFADAGSSASDENITLDSNWTEVKSDCCSLDETSITSMHIRECGQTVEVSNLDEPIEIVVYAARQSNDTENEVETRSCFYFDEDEQEWTTRGCKTVEMTDDYIVCQCNHLSSFGGAFGNFIKVIGDAATGFITCANAELLTESGLSRIGKGDWWHQRGSIILFVVIMFFIGLGYALNRSSEQHLAKYGVHRDGMLFVMAGQKPDNKKDKDHEEQESWERFRRAGRANGYGYLTTYLVWKASYGFVPASAKVEDKLMKSPLKAILALIAGQGLHMTAAGATTLSWEDSRLLNNGGDDKTWAQKSNPYGQVKRHLEGIEILSKKVAEEMELRKINLTQNGKTDALSQVWGVFKLMHPLVTAMHISLSMDWISKLMALSLNIFGTLAATALFLQSSSMSLSAASFAECQETDFWVGAVRDIMIAIVSSILAIVPPACLLLVYRRPIGYVEDQQARLRKVHRRIIIDRIVMCVAGVVLAFFLLLCVSFLANVRPSDTDHWFLSAMVTLLKAWLIGPLMLATAWAMFNTCCVQRSKPVLETLELVFEAHQAAPRNMNVGDAAPVGIAAAGPDLQDFQSWANKWKEEHDSISPSAADKEKAAAAAAAAAAAQSNNKNNNSSPSINKSQSSGGIDRHATPPPPPPAGAGNNRGDAPPGTPAKIEGPTITGPLPGQPELPWTAEQLSHLPKPPQPPAQPGRRGYHKSSPSPDGQKRKLPPPPPPPPVPSGRPKPRGKSSSPPRLTASGNLPPPPPQHGPASSSGPAGVRGHTPEKHSHSGKSRAKLPPPPLPQLPSDTQYLHTQADGAAGPETNPLRGVASAANDNAAQQPGSPVSPPAPDSVPESGF